MLLRLAATALLLSPVLAAQTRTPVLVELFTSEGCSSCPPADALLARLDHDQPVPTADIIVLSEHVDYWDQLGWRDRFSTHATTERQSRYSTRFNIPDIYTPQMVVGGQAQFNGSDSREAARAIVQAAQGKQVPLLLDAPALNGRSLSATLRLAGQAGGNAELYAALVDPEDTTQVRNGENGGKTLRHVGVVRSFTRIGTLKSLSGAPLSFTLDLPDRIHPIRLVVFAQTPGQGPVLGVVASGILVQDHKDVAATVPSDRNILARRN